MTDFLITPHPVANDVLLIDLSGIYWACYHATKNSSMSEAHDNTVAAVRRMREGRKYVVVCCDSGSSFRKEIYPEYKANREAKEPAAIAELKRACETLSKDGMHMWRVDGFEADDVIATATKEALKRGHTVTIASRDKDLMALVQDIGVQQLCGGDVLMDEQAVRTKLGVVPKLVPDLLVLMGDASDNIPGVQGVGPATAAGLLNKFGNLDTIVMTAKETPEKMLGLKIGTSNRTVGQSIIDNLAKHEEYDIAKQLVALRTDVPLPPFEQIYEGLKPKPINQETVKMAETIDEGDAEFDDPEAPAAPAPAQAPRQAEAPRPAEAPPKKTQDIQVVAPKSEVVPITRLSFELGLEPTTLGAAWKFANALWESKLYTKFDSPAAIFAIIVRGREWGMPAATSLDAFHVVEGRPYAHAHAIIAKAKADPDCEYFYCVEADAKHAIVETKHRRAPKPERYEYTIAMAEAAGLLRPSRSGKPSNWVLRPDDMLYKTAGSKLARRVYPGACGYIYSLEEMGTEELAIAA